MTQIARHGSNASLMTRSLPKRFSLSLLAFYIGSSVVLGSPASAQQVSKAHSPTLTYQASINQDGPLTITARLYSDPSGLELLWEENISAVSKNGILNLELGTSAPLPTRELDKGLFLGISVNNSEELRPLTKLTASPLALSVPDGAISKEKISASYIESITINGRKIEGSGASLKIETGKGITAGYDEGSNTILLASSSARSKGSVGTLSDEVIDGNLTVNGNTNLGGSGVNPTITFVAKAASALNMNGNALQNVGALSVSGSGSPISLNGAAGTSGQVLTSQGAGSTPTWTTPTTAWGTGGASGTTAGVDYLGTADDEPFEIHVHHNGSASEGRQRVLRFEPTSVSPNVVLGHNSNSVSGMYGGTIGGGGDAGHSNNVYREFGTISGGRANYAGQYATVGGGEYNEATNAYATVGGGYENVASSTNSAIAGGYSNWARSNGAFIGGGEDNTARGNLSVITGGYNNKTFSGASTIGGGEWNTTDNTGATVAGGSNNYADGYASAIGGGEYNYASGLHSAVMGGYNNSAYGHYSAIAGGRYLRLGGYSSGFNADQTDQLTDLSSMSGISYFGNTNILIGNVDNSARALRFYEANSALDYSGANYTSFKAPNLSTNVEYTLPPSQGAASSVLSNNGSGTLTWQVLTLNGDVTGPLGSNTVASVGGQSAANIASATIAANAATATNTASTIVKRDASGNFAANNITANLAGNVTGNLTGNVTGNVTGIHNGNVNGNVSGNLTGNVTGNLTGNVVGNVTGNLTGNVVGNVTGNVTGIHNGDVNGNVTGNLTGNVTGNLTGNVLGNVTGNVSGNAGTVTNGVYTTGSYANPNWIASLDASKITNLVIDNTSFTGNLSGDVTGTQSATVVANVGGASASSVASAVTKVNAASNTNVANSLVQRDASGGVMLGNVSASAGVNVTGGVLTLSTTSIAATNAGITLPSGYNVVRITTGTATSNFNYSLPATGTEGQLLYVYNNHSTKKAFGAVTIDVGVVVTFIYIGGNWVPLN
jgi:hypothetical protein